MSFLINFWDEYRFKTLQVQSITKCFSIQIVIIHDNISSQVVDKGMEGFSQ